MIEVIKSFEGIIGTVIGVILGSLITFFSQKTGRIGFYINSVSIVFQKNVSGYITDLPLDAETQFAHLKLDIDLFNNSDVIKVIRDIKLVLQSEKELMRKEISDLSTEQRSNYMVHYDKLKYVNLFPQMNDNFQLKIYFTKEEIPKFINKKFTAYLIGEKPRMFFKKYKYFVAKINNGIVEART